MTWSRSSRPKTSSIRIIFCSEKEQKQNIRTRSSKNANFNPTAKDPYNLIALTGAINEEAHIAQDLEELLPWNSQGKA